MTRPICNIVKDVLDNTDIEHIVTVVNVERLTDEICKALQAEGYETHKWGTET